MSRAKMNEEDSFYEFPSPKSTFLSSRGEIRDNKNFIELGPQSNRNMTYGENGRSEFCTPHNLPSSFDYINQEFQLLGIPCWKEESLQFPLDTVFYMNRLYDLLMLYQKTVAVKEDLEARNHRLVCETEHHQGTLSRLKNLQEKTGKELSQEKEKTRQMTLKYDQICSKLKAEKEEVRRLTSTVHSRDLQHKHELKKKEREAHRLKERLHQLLADKVPDRKIGIDLMNVVSRKAGDGKRGTWKTAPEKQEEEMYKLLINNYEDRHQELMLENAELRSCLSALHKELSTLYRRMQDLFRNLTLENSVLGEGSLISDDESDDDQDHLFHSDLSFKHLKEGHFQMPCDMLRPDIERTFRKTCDQIWDGVKKSLNRNGSQADWNQSCRPSINSLRSESTCSEVIDSKQGVSDTVAEVERLQKQVGTYKIIIQQQEDLLRQSLTSHLHSMDKSLLTETQLLKEKETLTQQKKVIMDEKADLERQKEAYNQAAAQIAKERQLLREDKTKLLQQQMMFMNTFRDNLRISKRDGQTSRLLPATPVFSPSRSRGRTSASNTSTDSQDSFDQQTVSRKQPITAVSNLHSSSSIASSSEHLSPVQPLELSTQIFTSASSTSSFSTAGSSRGIAGDLT